MVALYVIGQNKLKIALKRKTKRSKGNKNETIP